MTASKHLPRFLRAVLGQSKSSASKPLSVYQVSIPHAARQPAWTVSKLTVNYNPICGQAYKLRAVKRNALGHSKGGIKNYTKRAVTDKRATA
jgi:hypothetical protein